ncbi:hypothetical protein M8542_09220 [Amycolatopsis sp. OK19-0408]|uniref:Membrane-associated oxidoreductase n=1 Tax=Amycolatopsis iheyensis TaxID=2945988 RepID=A0A9X2N8S0_9PSEU|nr:hypothetical protein [Amycolatopsis iheyensis]MCR6482998.1 hypothetical protein [Amycolatopsis iheyensis]
MTDFPPLPVIDELTEPERELADAARRGRAVAPGAPIRAEVLRELLLGRRGPVDPAGVRVEGARIAGTLTLDHVEAVAGLALVGCVLVNPIGARRARLPWLELSGSRIAGFDGDGVRIDHDLVLAGVRASGDGEHGVVSLRDARVTGRVLLTGAVVTSADGPALGLDGLESGALRGVGLRASGARALGTVRLTGARVARETDFAGAELTNVSGPALSADGLVVDGDLSLSGATVTGAGEAGAARLLGARVGGALDLVEAVLTNESGPGLEADRLEARDLRCAGVVVTAGRDAAIDLTSARVGGQVDLDGAVVTNGRGRGLSADGIRVDDSFSAEGMQARGSGEYGALCLLSGHVGGNLSLDGAELANDAGAALSGDRLRVGGNVHFRELTAAGSGEPGTVRLLSARIDGELYCEEARLTNDRSPALHADGLHVGGNFDLTGAQVSGAGTDGALRLHNAEIGSQLRLPGAELANASGPAFSADDLRVGTYLDLSGVTATGSSEHGALSLRAARVDGSATFTGAEVTNDAGPALFADRFRVRDSLAVTGLRGSGAGEYATIHLLGAHVGGQLSFTGAELTHRDELLVSLEDAVVDGPIFFPAEVVGPAGQVVVDGFRFGSLADVEWDEWLRLIRDHTASYRPGPYQRLAAAERAAGHDGNARRILIAQQRDLQRWAPRTIGGWPARRFHWLWGFFAGYGYRARRTAAALLLAVLAAGALGLWAGHAGSGGHLAAERTADFGARAGTPCTPVELIGVGLERGLPLSPGVRGRCDLNTGIGAGQVFTVAIWLVQAAIWALATLALVGYTGLVRKTG